MTSSSLDHQASSFRAAVEAQDFSLAQTALAEYVKRFRSTNRTLQEVEEARTLLEWGVQAAKAQKAQMAEELMLLKRVCDAYGSSRPFHTWRLEG
jgi:hypothetical protein